MPQRGAVLGFSQRGWSRPWFFESWIMPDDPISAPAPLIAATACNPWDDERSKQPALAGQPHHEVDKQPAIRPGLSTAESQAAQTDNPRDYWPRIIPD